MSVDGKFLTNQQQINKIYKKLNLTPLSKRKILRNDGAEGSGFRYKNSGMDDEKGRSKHQKTKNDCRACAFPLTDTVQPDTNSHFSQRNLAWIDAADACNMEVGWIIHDWNGHQKIHWHWKFRGVHRWVLAFVLFRGYASWCNSVQHARQWVSQWHAKILGLQPCLKTTH